MRSPRSAQARAPARALAQLERQAKTTRAEAEAAMQQRQLDPKIFERANAAMAGVRGAAGGVVGVLTVEQAIEPLIGMAGEPVRRTHER